MHSDLIGSLGCWRWFRRRIIDIASDDQHHGEGNGSRRQPSPPGPGGIIFLAFFTAVGLTAYNLPLALILTFVLSIIFCSSYGFTIEKITYKPLRNAPRLSPLISAIGVSIFLQNYVMLTQGATDKVFPALFGVAGFQFMSVRMTWLQLSIILSSVTLTIALRMFVRKTRIGKAMRAVAQDKTMASLVGINIDTIISATFIIGSGLAAVAGLMVAMYYGLVNYSIGYIAGIKAFTAAMAQGQRCGRAPCSPDHRPEGW